MAEAIPYYTPGSDLTAEATAAVNAKRFLMVSGERTSDPTSVSDSVEGGNISVAQATAGSKPIGVAANDAAIGETVLVLAAPGMIVPVTAAGTISYGALISVTTDGKALTTATASAVAATINSGGSPGANNQLTYTARDAGYNGNDINVRLRDPAAASAALSVTLNANDIVVNLATNGSSVVTSTGALVKAAIEAHGPSNALIVVTHTGASSGAGVVIPDAGLQLAGGLDPATARVVGLAVAGCTTGEDCQVKLS